MVALCPSLRCSCRKATVSCREAEGFVMELWSPRFVTIVEIELLATVGWKWGCQPCSCRVWQNETHCRKEMCWTCLLKTSIPAIPCRNSKHPLPGRSNFLTAAARFTLFALGLQKIPSLRCSCRKNPSYAEKQRVWSWSCGLQDLLQCSDCALSCAMWLLQTVNNYRDWAVSSSGLEVGLPALQLPSLAKWDALPKGDVLDMFA